MIKELMKDKKIEDLKDIVSVVAKDAPALTNEKIEAAIKYLKFQGGCSCSEGNEDFIGKGDNYIKQNLKISDAQLKEIKEEIKIKIDELTPKEEVPEVVEPEIVEPKIVEPVEEDIA